MPCDRVTLTSTPALPCPSPGRTPARSYPSEANPTRRRSEDPSCGAQPARAEVDEIEKLEAAIAERRLTLTLTLTLTPTLSLSLSPT